jgi:predicted RNA-binding Zn-ribbon protein involved in translation (DUF1610 family)
MATSLRLSPELEASIKQLAAEHERSEHSEMLYGLKVYVAQQKSAKLQVEHIVDFWLSQMWASEDFGRVTAVNLYHVIQRYSDHPGKGLVGIEDCAQAMRRRAQESLPSDWTTEDQARIDEQMRTNVEALAELRVIDEKRYCASCRQEIAANAVSFQEKCSVGGKVLAVHTRYLCPECAENFGE